jgi:hypothetical protein
VESRSLRMLPSKSASRGVSHSSCTNTSQTMSVQKARRSRGATLAVLSTSGGMAR